MRTHVTTRLVALAMIVGGLCLFGCESPQPVTDLTPTLTAPLQVVKSEHTAARQDLATIEKVTTQPEVGAAAKSADGHIVNADHATDSATSAAVQVGKKSVADQVKLQHVQAKYDKVRTQLISPRMREWLWSILAIVIVGLVVFGFVHGTLWGLPVASAGEVVFNSVKTLGLYLVHWLAQHLGGLFHKTASTPAALKTPATPLVIPPPVTAGVIAPATGSASASIPAAA